MPTFAPIPTNLPIRQDGCSLVGEMAYSIEERGEDIGIARSGFAYAVTDRPFWNTLHEVVKLSYRGLAQYSFISLHNCLDVIADNPPRFELVDLSPWLDSMARGRGRRQS